MNNIKEVITLQKDYFTAKAQDENATYDFEPKLFGTIDLSVLPNQVFGNFNLSTACVFLFAILSAITQFIMSRQQDSCDKKWRKLV